MTTAHSVTRPLAVIIEDEEDLATGYAIALDEAGYETKIFLYGPPALELLAATVPALVLIDLNLPDISGEEILRRIQADERLVGMKITIVSADSTWASYLEDEVDFVLTKPVGFRQLRALAKRLNS